MQIKKNFNLIFILFCFFMIFLFGLSGKSFASFEFTDNDGNNHLYPDLPDVEYYDYIIVSYDPYVFLCLFNNENVNSYISIENAYSTRLGEVDVYYYKDNDGNKGTYTIYELSTDETAWEMQTTRQNITDWDAWYKVEFLYSSKPIYDVDNQETFFRIPPLSLMSQIVEGAKIWEVTTEIVKILPLIIVVVVSLVGLRKAWKVLSTLLHKA